MVSWSLIPGIGVHLFISDGLLVRNNSTVLLSLVGKLIAWLNPQSVFNCKNLSLVSFHWIIVTFYGVLIPVYVGQVGISR
jgi:hypothetical protein